MASKYFYSLPVSELSEMETFSSAKEFTRITKKNHPRSCQQHPETGCAGISCEVGGLRVKRKAWPLQKGLEIFLTDSNISGLYCFSAQ